MPDKPEQTPEGAAIQRALTRRPHLSGRQAATLAGISEGRWRQIVNGYQSARGQHIPVTAPAATIAHMAKAVGVTPDELTAAGRPDAADILTDLTANTPAPADPLDIPGDDDAVARVMQSDLPDQRKRDIVKLLLEEKKRAEQRRVERADEPIRLVRGAD